MPIPLRGLRTIRTFAGRVDRVCLPHRAHMQIACLEIEKTRRASEWTAARRRVSELDTRLREIEAEEAALFQRLADRSKGRRGDASGADLRAAPARTANALRIRY
jgi:uncharacterized membrane protein YccC